MQNTTVLRQGDPTDFLYIVVKGSCIMYRRADALDALMNELVTAKSALKRLKAQQQIKAQRNNDSVNAVSASDKTLADADMTLCGEGSCASSLHTASTLSDLDDDWDDDSVTVRSFESWDSPRYEPSNTNPLPWTHSHGLTPMDSLPWTHSHGLTPMDSLHTVFVSVPFSSFIWIFSTFC